MFVFNFDDAKPLYAQLYEQIRQRVLSGEMPAGTKLLSVRALADELSVSRNTVESAYQDLHAEGYIQTRPRSGYYVADLDAEAPAETSAPKSPGRSDEPEREPVWKYDFHPARLDPQHFPAKLWRKLAEDILREHVNALAAYRAPQGEWRLRSAIRDYLQRSRGVSCLVEQVVVCAGLQHGLGVLASLLRGRHPVVALEEPGYFLPRTVFTNHGFTLLPVGVGPEGLDVEALKATPADVVYVTPSHQFPLGSVMPVGHRLKLIEWAATGDKVIIEDDYDSELRYHGKPIASLQGLSPDGFIVYMGTFSKILSPALRLSYMVLPPSMLDAYKKHFGDSNASVSLLEQMTLASFMERGHWDRHIRRVRTSCKRKHKAMLQAIERHFGAQVAVVGQGAGLHVVLRVPEWFPEENQLLKLAREKGIRLFPFSATCAEGGSPANMLLLGFGAMSPDDIEQGVGLLADICKA